MATIYDVPQQELIEKTAEELKQVSQIKAPSWSAFVKTGVSRERPPVRKDWWHVRAASILKKIYRLGPIGTSKLRRKYGGRKNRGHAPEHTFKGSGNILRKIMQQLDAAGLTKQVQKGLHKGRIITPKGKSLMDKVSSSIFSQMPKVKQQAASKQEMTHAEAEHKEAKPASKKKEKKAVEAPAADE